MLFYQLDLAMKLAANVQTLAKYIIDWNEIPTNVILDEKGAFKNLLIEMQKY